MLPISNIAGSRGVSIASGFCLAILWLFFSVVHLQKYLETGELSLILLVIAETLSAVFYLLRTDPATVSTRPLDWLIAVAGTFSTFFFRPADYSLLHSANYLTSAGAVMLIFGLVSLNRSFALVPAKRVIKTSNMYRYIRHPLYASYFVMLSGYLLANFSITNALVYFAVISLLVARIHREEEHLMKDEAYRTYAGSTRYRIIPFVY
ncbi:methyltransferase family protein [Massilia sp. LjRoot122]|uniref:methyltransferase family protein n=1 Tax=Massilia sp. LjRoot122 TaxID=3342257 RepID=UPI003ECD392B